MYGNARTREIQRTLNLANSNSMSWLLQQVPVDKKSLPLQFRLQKS
jgi:hypothetical protein